MWSLLALPHSPACVERVFAQLNIIKIKETKRLGVSTAANRLLAKQATARQVVCLAISSSPQHDISAKRGRVATLHPDVEVVSDDETHDIPTKVFLR